MSVAHTTPASVASRPPHLAARWIGGGTLAATALDRRSRSRSGPPPRPTRPAQTASSSARRSPSSRTRRARQRSTPRSRGPRPPRSTPPTTPATPSPSRSTTRPDALDRAADGFVGTLTADDEFEQDLYEAELDVAVDDLTSQAEDFRTTGPEVQQAFWDGFDTGLDAA